MRTSRRDFLRNTGIKVPAAIAFPSISFAESPYKSFQLALSDITAESPPDGLLAVLEPIVNAQIPVSCIVSLPNGAATLDPDSSLTNLLRRIIASYPAQIEIVLEVPGLTDRPDYFQSRMATQARRALEDGLLTAPKDIQHIRSVLTVANFGSSIEFSPRGVRASGFRTVLSLPRSGIEPVDSRWIDGTLHIFGGMNFELTESFEPIEEALSQSVRDDPRSLLVLSLAGLASEDVSADVERMTKIVSLIAGLSRAGQIVPTTPTDFHFRSAKDAGTVIGLRLDVPGKPDDPVSASALELARWLRERNLKFTVAGHDAHFWVEDGTDVCPIVGQHRVDDQNRCRMLGVGDLGQPSLPPRVAMTTTPIIDPIAGVDHNATLHPPRVAFVDGTKSARQFISDIKPLEDTVLVLNQRSFNSVAQRHSTIEKIKMLNARLGFEVTDVASLTKRIQTPLSVERVYHQTQEIMHRERAALATPQRLNRDLFRDDAALAWRYFRKFTNSETGLIPSTAFLVGGNTTRYDYTTMWDVGSQILGMIAAVELDLLTKAELDSWAERLITGLPTVTLQGLRLPSSIIHIGNTEEPDQSFTTCDVGRLLNSFDRLRAFSPTLKDIIESKVAGWDLQETIHEGRMQDLTRRRTSDHFISHCTDYSVRGYAAFGVASDSPYAKLTGPSDADDLIELLYSASTIGSLGAEPLLLEGIELGFSPTTKYLADMLFAAQVEDNRMTGTMRCVSECPLDQSPWFTYQGYNLNDFAQPWTVQVRQKDERYTRPEFLKSIEVVSVKAAFLWAATHPHSYSSALVDYVRARARIEGFGFSSGIYLETGLAMKDYSDLNTNAIILQAAAFILSS